ncbi:geranylgeranyl diphosphate synthase, type II [Halolactibacillus halophilus]|uniref:Farnesyl diphosphate synthase n=1 Tax=Halolactibacillus halophilus TaxID=306540 RepID=A0A1I5SUJ0_9BACI|nr:farnesyl diphosphate synthase [Halolactibacillus halophilus]GEM02729.1 farnesyl-diphosphate synthase [Halolactibacillus halophilus]SFP74409.1 geranylgeranyl diphosphate synthase, type II [Halolactibacillus halophilus]
MTDTIDEQVNQYKTMIDQRLGQVFDAETINPRLKQAMRYSLTVGGKRVRPILMLLTAEAFGTDIEKVLPVALALECVHTYSLIHDDLPAMDDDDYRRGELTNHKKFDEATAILAGDALLTYSFQLISEAKGLTADEKVHALKRLSEVSGPSGMVGGQMYDLSYEDTNITLNQLEQVHDLKTGQLLIYALEMGAFLSHQPLEVVDAMKRAAAAIGLTFQIQDDILDIIGDEQALGKKVGSDVLNDKSTYPKLLGLEGAKKEKQKFVDETKHQLELTGVLNTNLAQFVISLSDRFS